MHQWHPIFAQLLRPAVEAFYEVQTTVPVGDAPREADFALLRRTGQGSPPFRGLWRHLTAWNVLEFKGPTVSPRGQDLSLLVELGLGIDRRLRQGKRRPGREEVSFWYLANRLGRRFRRDAAEELGPLAPLGPGLWRCTLLGRLVFLVSSVNVPVEPDNLPLHVVGREPPATERQVARLVVERPELQRLYGGWLASLSPAAWREVEALARSAGRKVKLDLRPAIEYLGLGQVIRQVGLDRVIQEVGDREVVKEMGVDRFLAALTPAQRRELLRRVQENEAGEGRS